MLGVTRVRVATPERFLVVARAAQSRGECPGFRVTFREGVMVVRGAERLEFELGVEPERACAAAERGGIRGPDAGTRRDGGAGGGIRLDGVVELRGAREVVWAEGRAGGGGIERLDCEMESAVVFSCCLSLLGDSVDGPSRDRLGTCSAGTKVASAFGVRLPSSSPSLGSSAWSSVVRLSTSTDMSARGA